MGDHNRRTYSIYLERGIFIAAVLLLAVCPAAPAGKTVLKVGIPTDIPPYVMKHATSGIEVDLMRKLLDNYAIQFVQLSYHNLQRAVPEKRVDVAVGVQEAHGDGVHYSHDLVIFKNYAISKAAAHLTINRIADLADHRVLTWEGAYRVLGPEFKDLFSPGSPHHPNYVEIADQDDQVRTFWREPSNVIIIDQSIFIYLSQQLGHSMGKVTFHPIFPDVTGYKAGFEDAGLLDTFQQKLTTLCRSGGYPVLIAPYHVEVQPIACAGIK